MVNTEKSYIPVILFVILGMLAITTAIIVTKSGTPLLALILLGVWAVYLMPSSGDADDDDAEEDSDEDEDDDDDSDDERWWEDCPECGTVGEIKVALVEETVQVTLSMGDSLVELPVEVPVLSCNKCGFEWTDYRAEEIRDDALSDFLEQ